MWLIRKTVEPKWPDTSPSSDNKYKLKVKGRISLAVPPFIFGENETFKKHYKFCGQHAGANTSVTLSIFMGP